MVNKVKPWGRILLASTLTLLIVATYFCVPAYLLKTDSLQRSDVIVVLGYPPGNSPYPPSILTARVKEATALYGEGLAPRILFSGGETAPGMVEADAMATMAQSFGVPRSAMLTERVSLSTIQNIENSMEIAKYYGWEKILIVTSGFHTRRVQHLIRDCRNLRVTAPRSGDRWGYQATLRELALLSWVFLTAQNLPQRYCPD